MTPLLFGGFGLPEIILLLLVGGFIMALGGVAVVAIVLLLRKGASCPKCGAKLMNICPECTDGKKESLH
jgi:amino acid permease